MKNLLNLFLLVLIGPTLFAQNLGEESFTMSPQPWSGDWMPERLNTLVGGEEFLGFPGPLPKVWYALGLDPQHPSVDFELKERVKRDSPYWYGTCNGWAAAATQFDEPESVVINGVKIFSSEMKAILATIWKDNIELTQGSYDSQGITPRSFEEVLYNFVALNKGIIFDVDLGEESWNYPVVGFTRNAVENGDWVDVSVTVRYANSVEMKLLEQNYDNYRYLDLTYTYRYNSEGTYEWTGESVTKRPQRAWYTRVPYLYSWFVRGNRHLNMGVYSKLETLGSAEGNLADRFEPNGSLETAYAINEKLLLGSLPEGDTDYFRLEQAAGEVQTARFRVYDGPDVDLTLRDDQGNVLATHVGICELDLAVDGDYDGVYFVEISSPIAETSFYELQYMGDRGFYRITENSPYAGGVLKAISIREQTNHVVDGQVNALQQNGLHEIAVIEPGQLYRASERTVWAAEQIGDDRVYKQYARGHILDMDYVVPHLTCRNGWKTLLQLDRSNSDDVAIRVFDLAGQQLTRMVLPEGQNLDLGQILNSEAASAGTWFQLETTHANVLRGFVSYVHDEIAYRADFDISARPRNGEMVLHQLPRAGEGWVGLAITNVSGVENPMLWRVLDGNGDVVADGELLLAPGQKWLGLPQHLVDIEFGPEYTLYLFSQFNAETLALRHDTVNGVDYAHRLPNPIIDFMTETFVSLPIAGNDTASFYLLNPNDAVNYVRFRGYDAMGNELVEHRLNDAPFFSFDSRYFTLTELLTEAGLDPENHGIAHFKITCSRPLLLFELAGLPGKPYKQVVPLVNIFEEP